MLARTNNPPSPQLTLQLVKYSDLAWLPIGVAFLIAGGLAIGFRGRIAWAELGMIGALSIAFGLTAASVGLWWVWRASRAMSVQFAAEIQVVRLLGATVHIAWKDVAEVAFHRSEREYQQESIEGLWLVPIPGIGSLTVTSSTTKTRWQVDRYVELLDSNRRPIVRISRDPMDELRFSLWYERHQLRQSVGSLNGSIIWDEQGLTRISLAGANIDDNMFLPIKQRLLRLRELRELNLSRTKVTAASLDGLDQCESLKLVDGTDSPIPAAELEDFNQRLKNRGASAGFGFLQPQKGK